LARASRRFVSPLIADGNDDHAVARPGPLGDALATLWIRSGEPIEVPPYL
jgi:hypothetical protein